MVKEADEAVRTDAGESETAAVCITINSYNSTMKFFQSIFKTMLLFSSVYVNLKIALIKLN